MVVNWNEYTLTVQLGYLLLGLLAGLFIILVVYRIVLALLALPGRASEFRRGRLVAKGQRALMRGFVAAVAGNGKEALKQAERARAALSGDEGLLFLLEAQAYRMQGDMESCEAALKKLSYHKDLAYLGVRGMIRLSVESGRMDMAMQYARQAMLSHSGQPEMLRMVYQLQLSGREWEQAGKTLTIAVRKGAIPKERAESDKAALGMAKAEEMVRKGQDEGEAIKEIQKVNRKYPDFLPASIYLAEAYTKAGKKRKAARIIEKAWKIEPHPELAGVWEKLAPGPKVSDPARGLRWSEKLVILRPDSAESHLLAARAAMEDSLWGEARKHLDLAEAIKPGARLFRLRAELEDRATHSSIAYAHWLEKAAQAPPDKVWVCKITGRIYEEWSPVADPGGLFNTIIWGYPDETCQAGDAGWARISAGEWLPLT